MGIRLVVLGSGSAGNATLIEGGGARLLLDAGFSSRDLAARLLAVGVEPHRLDTVLVTHEHADHVRGASLFSRTHRVSVRCTARTLRAASLDRQGLHRHLPVEAGMPFVIGDLTITPFPVPHDAVDTVGYVFETNGTRVAYATDFGHAADAVRERLRDADILMLESNHDVDMLRTGPYPQVVKDRVLGRHGHLDNDTAAGLASEAATDRTARVVLLHLSRTNNRPDVALGTWRGRFDRDGRRAPALHAAAQDRPSPWFEA